MLALLSSHTEFHCAARLMKPPRPFIGRSGTIDGRLQPDQRRNSKRSFVSGGMMMKKPLMSSLALCVAFLGGPNAAFADQACSQETLFGSYLFYATGADKNGKPTAFAGIDYYDGKGGILSTTTYSNGKSSNGTGTYRVDRNCKAEARYSDKSRNTYFISPTGDELVWVDTAGDITAGPEKRISKDNLIGR